MFSVLTLSTVAGGCGLLPRGGLEGDLSSGGGRHDQEGSLHGLFPVQRGGQCEVVARIGIRDLLDIAFHNNVPYGFTYCGLFTYILELHGKQVVVVMVRLGGASRQL